ncbi:MAG: CopG family transcriptional regulator [Candidatus Sumerlaeia bacterium]
MKAKDLDKKFDRGENILGHLDLSRATRANQESRRVNVDFPVWMIKSLDKEAGRLGVTRQSIIKVWIAERLSNLSSEHENQ